MIKIKFLLSIFLIVAVVILVGGDLLGNVQVAEALPGVGWVDDGTVVRLDAATDSVGIGTTSPGTQKLGVVGLGLFSGILTVEDHIKTTNLIATGTINVSGNILVGGLVDGFDISSSAPSWDQAFNQRNRWDGNSDGLNAATGRTSLGLGSLATLNSVSGGSGGTISDNSVTNHDLATSTFWNINGVGVLPHVILDDTDGSNCHRVTVNSAGTLSTTAANCDTGSLLANPTDSFDSYSSGNLDGKSGGSGWSTNWAKQTSDDFAIQTSSCQSGNCVKADAVSTVGEARTFATLSDGSISMYLKRAAEDNEGSVIFFCGGGATTCDNASETFGILFRRSSFGDVHLRASGSPGADSDNLGSWTANVWQQVEVQFGGTGGVCSSTQARARLNGGSWSTCRSMDAQNTIGSVYLTGGGSNDELWVDELTISAD